ncbi:hypothetical protein GW17_00027769 [Ensete ventricosum]|nr:hypothetical protein GW17_00027769 [Ensete ventricosum]
MAQAAVAVASVRHSPWPRLSSIFSSGKHPQHLFFSVARALKPLAPQALEGDGDGEPDAPAVKKSRNELKREARRAVKWGMELASFSNPQIKRVLRAADISSGVDEQLWSMAGFMASLSATLLVFFLLQGVLSNAGDAALSTTGFALETGQSKSLDAPAGWSGRLWARTLCATDSYGRFSCRTGDCGSGKVECSGGGATPPVSLAEFTPGGGGGGGMDYHDVSLVDGYNLPMLVVPQGGRGGEGGSTGCVADLNGVCPSDLKVVAARSSSRGSEGVACMSACEAFGSPQYCCSGAYGNPNTCMPSSFSQFFKNACPKAYSYAFDDATSTFTCASADYRITFCPITAR